jgi:hypothetical protein
VTKSKRNTSGSSGERFSLWRERMRDPSLTALTVLLAIFMFVIAPLHAAGIVHSQALSFGLGLVLLGGALVASKSPAAVIALLFAIFLSGAATVFRSQGDAVIDLYLDAWSWIILGTALIWAVGPTVFARGRVTFHRIVGAILLYLTAAIAFAGVFLLVALLAPNSIAGLTVERYDPTLPSLLIYFSLGALTSSGSGDLAPLHPVARSLYNFQTIIGQLYPATLLARLVSLEVEGRSSSAN